MKIPGLRSIVHLKAIFALVATAMVLSACGGGGGSDAGSGGGGASSDEIVLHPVGNEMRFEETSFTVEAGQEVTLVFENTATTPAMQHNVVILNTNDDTVVNRVGQAALQAGPDAEYIPDDPAILAHTPLSQPGETVEVTFTAPSEPGQYRYICTFPGHYVLMQGTMTVQ